MKRLAALLVFILPCAALWLGGTPLLGHALMAAGQPGLAATVFADAASRASALYAAGQWQAATEAFGTLPENAYNRANALARLGHYAEAVEAYGTALDMEPDNADARFNLALVSALVAEGAVDTGTKGSAGADSQAIEERQGHALPAADGETVGTGNGFAGSQEGSSSRGAQGGGKIGKTGKAGDNNAAGDGQAKGSASSGGGAGRSGGMALDVAVTTALQGNNQKIQRLMVQHAVTPTPDWLASLPDDPGKYLKLRILAEQERRKGGAMASGEDR